MQLVKNLYTADRARSGLAGYKRKIREAKLAEELENEHSKDWILEKYLNTTSYGTVGGQTAIGVEAAARVYFNKRAKHLTLREAALLAGPAAGAVADTRRSCTDRPPSAAATRCSTRWPSSA